MPWQKTELIDLTVKTVDQRIATVCKDGQGVLLNVTFSIKVNRAHDDILEVARNVGAEKTFQPDIGKILFGAKFEEAVRTAASRREYADLLTHREEFRDNVKEVIGRDLNGYYLEDVAVSEILPSDAQRVALGGTEFTLEWLEVNRKIRVSDLKTEHSFSVLATRHADGTVNYTPKGDSLLSPGDQLAVAVPSINYEALKNAFDLSSVSEPA